MSEILLSDRLKNLDRKVVLGGLVLVLVLLFVVAYFFTSGGSGEPGEGELMTFSDSGPGSESGADGLPFPSSPQLDESVIEERVAATLAAMPTPEPTVTPDIGATLAAELAQNRPERSLVLNPLDFQDVRTPHLTEDELEYFRAVGRHIWVYTRVWFRIQETLAVGSSDWTVMMLSEDVEWSRELLASLPKQPGRESGAIGEVVEAYLESLELGMDGVDDSISRLEDAEKLLDEALVIGLTEREQLARIARDIERLSGDFDDVMSSYGCSICGELFRYRASE